MSATRTVPEVLQDIVGNIQEIIRSEFRLAKTEIKEEAAKATKPAVSLGTGIVLGFYALGFILWTIVLAIATQVAMWIAALIVGGVLAIVSLVLITGAMKKLKHVKPVPEKTIESLKENVQWAKNQTK